MVLPICGSMTSICLCSGHRMNSEISSPAPAVDIQETLLKLLVKELRRAYDHVDVIPAIIGTSIPNDPQDMLRIFIRWYDNSALARVLFAAEYLIVELGPRQSDGWDKVDRVRYQDPRCVERIFGLVAQALP
jgi:hypothetical protein